MPPAIEAVPAYPLVLRGGRIAQTPDTTPVGADLAISADGRIERLEAALPARGVEEWDLGGRLVMPAPVDIHQHLDKTGTGRLVANPTGTLVGAILGFESYARHVAREDIVNRAERAALACLARGTVAIRSHVDVDPAWGLRGLEALIELRERLRTRMRIQVAAMVASGDALLSTADARNLLEAALAAGADVVGGVPAFVASPVEYLEMLFEVAAQHDRALDLHIDETLDPRSRHLEHVARLTKLFGFAGRVVAGHCCSLDAMPRGDARAIIDQVADAQVAVVTLPACNLFLQGREASMLVPRGLTRVVDLIDAGTRVAFASDNMQDPFNPVGTGDLLEIGRWMFLAGHLPPGALCHVVAMGTTVPAALMFSEHDYGLRVGAFADLLIVSAEDSIDAFVSGPLERTVFFHGRHVAGPVIGAEVRRS
jgi:cytosine deaminase